MWQMGLQQIFNRGWPRSFARQGDHGQIFLWVFQIFPECSTPVGKSDTQVGWLAVAAGRFFLFVHKALHFVTFHQLKNVTLIREIRIELGKGK
ncbi:MAG: hypothetical protein K8T89_17090 [Planctomycetes bacterium]|nr:hypothetical protein [Planctomycetota bacterium]